MKVATLRNLVVTSQVDYRQAYIKLYAAYNALYRVMTAESHDAIALRQFQHWQQVWQHLLFHDQYERLRISVRRLYILTTYRPLTPATQWEGRLNDIDDWRGMMHCWYRVRCAIVHGETLVEEAYFEEYVRICYDSLHLFMTHALILFEQQQITDITPLRLQKKPV